jgi:hypothetical protein
MSNRRGGPRGKYRDRRGSSFIEHNGKKQSISKWSRESGVSVTTICNRIKQGWPSERILEPARPYNRTKQPELAIAA